MKFCKFDHYEKVRGEELDGLRKLYASNLYELMEREETKIWQYSTEKLYELFLEESSTGKISFPQV